MHHRNWRIFLAATGKDIPCRGQLYQKHKLERALEIVEKSFTYGAKLKRNPVSEKEREIQAKNDEIERLRFSLYRRAHMLRTRKSKSISGTLLVEKNEFYFDWEERQKGIKKGKKRPAKKNQMLDSTITVTDELNDSTLTQKQNNR